MGSYVHFLMACPALTISPALRSLLLNSWIGLPVFIYISGLVYKKRLRIKYYDAVVKYSSYGFATSLLLLKFEEARILASEQEKQEFLEKLNNDK